MKLQNTVTGALVQARFEKPAAPEKEELALILEEETGNNVCSKEGARKFKFLQGTEDERSTALQNGYHFAP